MWSKYHGAPGDTVLLRAGTLDHPEAIKPDVHIRALEQVGLAVADLAPTIPAPRKTQ